MSLTLVVDSLGGPFAMSECHFGEDAVWPDNLNLTRIIKPSISDVSRSQVNNKGALSNRGVAKPNKTEISWVCIAQMEKEKNNPTPLITNGEEHADRADQDDMIPASNPYQVITGESPIHHTPCVLPSADSVSVAKSVEICEEQNATRDFIL